VAALGGGAADVVAAGATGDGVVAEAAVEPGVVAAEALDRVVLGPTRELVHALRAVHRRREGRARRENTIIVTAARTWPVRPMPLSLLVLAPASPIAALLNCGGPA
jgi:hypothetical protein